MYLPAKNQIKIKKKIKKKNEKIIYKHFVKPLANYKQKFPWGKTRPKNIYKYFDLLNAILIQRTGEVVWI